MAKNLLNESTVRQWMKLANVDRHADDVVSKYGLLKEEDEKSELEEETEESGESDEGPEEESEGPPPAPEEPEVELDSIPSNEDDESVDTTMEDLKSFIADAIKTALSEMASSGELEIGSEPEGDMGMGAEPGMDAGAEGGMPPAPEMGGEPGMEGGAPPAAAPPAPEEEETPPAPVMENKGKAGLASKGSQGKNTFSGGKQKATMTKAKNAGLASKGSKKALEESEVVEEEVIEEEQLDEAGMTPEDFADAAKKKNVGAKYAQQRRANRAGVPLKKQSEEERAVAKRVGIKGVQSESRKAMMEAYIARYGKQQLVKEVSKRVAQRLAEAKQRSQKKG